MKTICLFLLFLLHFPRAEAKIICEAALGDIFYEKKVSENVIRPKYRLKDLDDKDLEPGRSDLILGETGQSIWVIEKRKVLGFKEAITVAVKYFKKDSSEIFEYVDRLQKLKFEIDKMGLSEFVEVATPFQIGSNFLVFPFYEAESLNDLTFRRLSYLKPPKKFEKTFINEMGPGLYEQDPQLFSIWSREQRALRMLVQSFKLNGFRVLDRVKKKSWSGQDYIAFYLFNRPGTSELYSIRNDLLITTDGKIVIVDPY